MKERPWQRSLLFPALGIWLLVVGCGSQAPLATAPPSPAARSTAQLDETLPILRFSRVSDPLHPGRQIYRGGEPSEGAMQRLATLGIKTIVSLQDAAGEEEEAISHEHEMAMAARLGMSVVSLPLSPDGAPPTWAIDRFIRILSDSEREPVFVHCLWGRDRTGAMIAAYRIHEDHYTAQQALAEMESFGFIPDLNPALVQFVRDYAAQGG